MTQSGSGSRDHIRLTDDHLGLTDAGDVDETPLVDGRTSAGFLCLVHRGKDFARLGDGGFGWGKDLVREHHLFGMDGPFSDHTEGRRAERLRPEPLVIREITERPVDGQNTVGPAGRHDGRLRPVPRVGPVTRPIAVHVVVFLSAADPGRLHPHGGRQGSWRPA